MSIGRCYWERMRVTRRHVHTRTFSM